MKLSKHIIVACVLMLSLLGSINFLKAQDPQFSQFYANKLYLNPAFAGELVCPRLSIPYRNQWPALGETYVTYCASYDQHVSALEGALGGIIMQDVQGDGAITTTSFSGMYTYTLNISRTFSLKGGFQATYIQKKLDWNFIFPDMMHPLYGPIYPTSEQRDLIDPKLDIWDFSTGFIGFTRDYFVGIAVHHLTQPAESWRGSSEPALFRKWTLHAGTTIPLKARGFKRGELSLSPNLLFQQQNNYQQINYGLYLNRNSIVAGIWVRHNFQPHYDSFIMLIGFLHKKIRIGYSYDLTVSKLKNHTLGAHEVTLSTLFNCPQKAKKLRAVRCPSF